MRSRVDNRKINDIKVDSAIVDAAKMDDYKLEETKVDDRINCDTKVHSTILKIINNIYCLYFIDYIFMSHNL